MITRLSLESFKCYDRASITFGPLTVFSGGNASGKSSAIQAMLLLRQSAFSLGIPALRSLHLGGELFDAGTAADVVNVGASDRALSIGLNARGKSLRSTFSYPPGEANQRRMRRSDGPSDSAEGQSFLKYVQEIRGLALFSQQRQFCYLSAERLGPRASYPVPKARQQIAGAVGQKGEFTAHVLALRGQEKIANEALAAIVHDGTDRRTLLGLTRYWLNRIVPGADLQAVTEYSREDFSYFDVSVGEGSTTYFRPTNTGFGIAYCLPIIVGALVLEQKGMLIVENPEAHLHPRGQSEIGRFLAQVANSGVQVIIETHSDHVLNGIRLAVKDKQILNSHVALSYFERSGAPPRFEVMPIAVGERGNIDVWPSGFFDQLEKDLDRLLDTTALPNADLPERIVPGGPSSKS